MQIVTHIYNNKNVVIRNFTIEHFIEAEDQDSDRDKLICEHLKPIKFRGKPRYIIERLLAHPDEFIAHALRETVAVADSHATLYRDFSLIVCGKTIISSHSNIFDFIFHKNRRSNKSLRLLGEKRNAAKKRRLCCRRRF